MTYENLGILDAIQGRFESAETWMLKALAIWRKLDDKHREEQTLANLAILRKEAADASKSS